jgi:sigma-B regulation protein RsbU (phosphoserine phosphatase)
MNPQQENLLNDPKSFEGAFELRSLFEFSAVVNDSLDLKFILSHFLLTLMGKLLSLRGMVLLESEKYSYRIENVKGLSSELVGTKFIVDNIPNRILYTNLGDLKKYRWMKDFKEHGIHLLIPLVAQDKIVGIAGFAPGTLKNKLTKKESTYIKSLANIAATAIDKNIIIGELKQVNRKLDGKIQELNTLFEMSKEFNAVLDTERLLKLLMFSVMGQIGVNRFVICLERDGRMDMVASRLEEQFNPELCTYISTLSKPLLVKEIARKSDLPWRDSLAELGIHALIPFRHHDKTKGLLAVGEKIHGEGYSQTDLEFLSSLGNLAIIALENARLFTEAIEKQRMEDDLLIAKDIQKGLLPARLPDVPNFDVAATNISSKQVGGDYYDFINLNPNHYVIAIGDVSGKGTPASLLMANLQATIRALVPFGLSLAELTRRVNDLICDNTSSGRFITFFWGMLYADSRIFKYVNAGHNLPFLIHSDGSVMRLDKGGIILGIMKAVVPYQEGEVKMDKGDVLVLFTDGVSEAMNLKAEEFSEELLEEIIKANLKETSEEILRKVVDNVHEHSQGTAQSDDITLVVVKAIA